MLGLKDLSYDDTSLLVAPYKSNKKEGVENNSKPIENNTGIKNKPEKINKNPRRKLKSEKNNEEMPAESIPKEIREENHINVIELLRGKSNNNSVDDTNKTKKKSNPRNKITPPLYYYLCWKKSPSMVNRYDETGKLVQARIIVSQDEEENYYEDEENFRIKWPGF